MVCNLLAACRLPATARSGSAAAARHQAAPPRMRTNSGTRCALRLACLLCPAVCAACHGVVAFSLHLLGSRFGRKHSRAALQCMQRASMPHSDGSHLVRWLTPRPHGSHRSAWLTRLSWRGCRPRSGSWPSSAPRTGRRRAGGIQRCVCCQPALQNTVWYDGALSRFVAARNCCSTSQHCAQRGACTCSHACSCLHKVQVSRAQGGAHPGPTGRGGCAAQVSCRGMEVGV